MIRISHLKLLFFLNTVCAQFTDYPHRHDLLYMLLLPLGYFYSRGALLCGGKAIREDCSLELA